MKTLSAILLVGALSWGAPLHGQGGAVEVGAGFGVLTFQSGGGSEAFQFQTGGAGVYFGIPMGSRIALEPAISIDFTHVEDFDLLIAGFTLGLPIYLQNQRQGLFFEPFATMSFIKNDVSGEGDSDLQFGFGGSIGGKFPVADRVSLRLELPVAYFLESDHRTDTFAISAQFGIAVFFGGD